MVSPTPPDPLMIGLGLAIREARERQRLSQERLGLESGVHRNFLGGIERAERNPSVETIVKLARALGVPVSELFARAERQAG